MTFATQHHKKILDRTKTRTARKRDKSGKFTINDECFKAELEIVMTQTAFISLFESEFYTHEEFGFDSSIVMWDYYNNYYEANDLVYVHKIVDSISA